MSRAPAACVTVAIALALWGCVVAPSPSLPPPRTPSLPPTPSPTARDTAAAAGSVLFVGWETRADRADLLVIDEGGAIARMPLPAIPGGPVVAGPDGALAFVSGPADTPLLWTSSRPPDAPRWESQPLAPPVPLDEPLSWLCLGSGAPPRVAVQAVVRGALVAAVVADGRLALFPPGRLAHRPGGCAWVDRDHLLVAVDRTGPPLPSSHGLAIVSADGSGERLLDGPGGDEPTLSATLLAYVAHEGGRDYRIAVGRMAGIEGRVPEPSMILRPEDERTFLRPVLSIDGRRLALLEEDAAGRPTRLLLWELDGEAARLSLAVEIAGALAAGPAWVADALAP